MKKNTHNILVVINPTDFGDYDIIAIGDVTLLRQLSHKDRQAFHLIEHSQFGGISILILDTCNTLRDAKKVIKEYKGLAVRKVRTRQPLEGRIPTPNHLGSTLGR